MTDDRLLHPMDDLWWASKRGAAAFVLLAFPFLFILDEHTDLGFSPVLPGLATLVLMGIVLPFLWMELGSRIVMRSEHVARNALRARQTAKASFGIAVAWVLLWFALGA